MSKESQRVYIEGRMAREFKRLHPNVKVGYANTNFKEPKEEVYATFTILGGKGVVVGGSGGSNVTTRYPGIVQVTFWSPDETGTSAATKLAGDVQDIFEFHRGRDSEGNVITFKAAEEPNGVKINGWYPTILKIPFYRDEMRKVS